MDIMYVLHVLHVMFVYLWPVAKELVKIGLALLLNAHIRMIIRDEIGPLAERYFRWRNEQRELRRQREAQAQAENVRNAQPEKIPQEADQEAQQDAHVPKRPRNRNTTYRRNKRRDPTSVSARRNRLRSVAELPLLLSAFYDKNPYYIHLRGLPKRQTL
ncbi:hypothetical protein HDV57DRAFT_526244 [Trichoderma longibrachiatum]